MLSSPEDGGGKHIESVGYLLYVVLPRALGQGTEGYFWAGNIGSSFQAFYTAMTLPQLPMSVNLIEQEDADDAGLGYAGSSD